MISARDLEFRVDFTYRLRFTGDVLRRETSTLLELMPAEGAARVLFVVDAQVADAVAWLVPELEGLGRRFPDRVELSGPVHRVAGGEGCKNSSEAVDALLDRINADNLDRRNYVVVIGGGAVLDAVGLAAAVAHRGVRLIRLPTTTLGQDDSGIGVKNAINRYDKKNWQGTFAVPWAVVNDQQLLETLPDRDFRAGFSEAVKVSLLKEPAFFDYLCRHARDLADRRPDVARQAIERSAVWHLQHITRGGDPFEMLEARPLDFGHWSAHKLEPMTAYRLRHGEAVAVGLAIDCVYSSMIHGLPADDAERVCACLEALGLTLSHPLLADVDTLLGGLEEFRQHLGGQLTVTMLRGVGDPIDVHRIDREAMAEAIRRVARRPRIDAPPARAIAEQDTGPAVSAVVKHRPRRSAIASGQGVEA